MVYRVSTKDLFNTVTRNINTTRNNMNKITAKNGASNVYDSFAELGLNNNIRTVIDIKSESQHYDTYNKNATIAKLKIEKTLASISQIYDVALELEKSLVAFAGSPFYGKDLLINTATTKLKEVSNILNANVNGYYIFSGSQSSLPPVKDLSIPNITLNNSDNIDYRNGFITTNYYQGDNVKNNVILDDNFVLEYGVTANCEPFAKIIASLHMVANATDSNEIMDRAQNTLLEAMNELLELEQQVKHNYSIIEKYQSSYNDIKATLFEIQENIDNENEVDFVSMMTKYVENEAILSSAQYMFTNLNRMSIIDFLR